MPKDCQNCIRDGYFVTEYCAECQKERDLVLSRLENRGRKILQQLLHDHTIAFTEASELLEIPPENVSMLPENDGYLFVEGRCLVYPIQEPELLERFSEALAALDERGFDQLDKFLFFIEPDSMTDGDTPLQALREGRMTEVHKAVRCYMEHGAR